MAAVLGADDDAVEAACQRAEGEVWVANYNAPGQVGHRRHGRSRRGARRSHRQGARRPRVMPVPVAGAFHTSSWPRPGPACARRCRTPPFVDARDPRGRQRRRARPHRGEDSGPACSRPSCAAPCAGDRACATLASWGPPGSSRSGRAACSPGWPGARCPTPRPLRWPPPTTSTTWWTPSSGSETLAGLCRRPPRRAPLHLGAGRGLPRRRGVRAHRRAGRAGARERSSATGTGARPRRWTSPAPSVSVQVGELLGTSERPRSVPRSRAGWSAFWPIPASGSPRASPSPGCASQPAASEPGRGTRRAHVAVEAVITGWGTALPDTVVTNADLEARLDTTDEWIVERSGIRERRIGGTVSILAIEAGPSGPRPRRRRRRPRVDLLVLATSTPDLAVPATSAAVHDALGLSRRGLRPQRRLRRLRLRAGGRPRCDRHRRARRVLVIGADCVSLHHRPRRPGHGGALRRRRRCGRRGGRATTTSTCSPRTWASTAAPTTSLTCAHGGYMAMEGREVFRRAVRITVDSRHRRLRAGQAHARRHRPVRPPPGQPAHHRSGRPSASASPWTASRSSSTARGTPPRASIPLALAEAADRGRLEPGDNVLFSGFGAGMTWASAIVALGTDRRTMTGAM